MKKSVRLLTLLSGLCLIATFFYPIWLIVLEAPQFPEGLSMHIWANKITGNVDTINGLNHYIGMQKISEASFPELKYLPKLMGFFLGFGIIAALLNKKSVLYTYATLLILFAVVALVDFYMWEYRYGHDLDPKAPIKLDGASFQPPLIGYKQIANFLAGSFPAVGGVFFIVSVTLAALAMAIQLNIFKRRKSNKTMNIMALIAMMFFASCSNKAPEPQPIKFGTDNCDHCKMTISDKKFGAEMVNSKGKAYKFDDIGCMLDYKKEYAKSHPDEQVTFFSINYYSPEKFVNMQDAFILQNGSVRTPMASGMVAFGTKEDAEKAKGEYGGEVVTGASVMGVK